jgi:tetratricopeptide (TPR) repeat protein
MFREDPRFACALAALDRRDFSTAAAALGALLESADAPHERAFLLNKRGVARIGLEQRELARSDFSAALAASDGFAPALTNLGNLALESDDLEAAIALYERALANDAEYAIAYLNLGVAYKRAGRLDKAVRALRQAQRLEQRARASNAWTSWRPARPR